MQTKRTIGIEQWIASVRSNSRIGLLSPGLFGDGYEHRCEECTCGPDCECGGDCGGNCTC